MLEKQKKARDSSKNIKESSRNASIEENRNHKSVSLI